MQIDKKTNKKSNQLSEIGKLKQKQDTTRETDRTQDLIEVLGFDFMINQVRLHDPIPKTTTDTISRLHTPTPTSPEPTTEPPTLIYPPIPPTTPTPVPPIILGMIGSPFTKKTYKKKQTHKIKKKISYGLTSLADYKKIAGIIGTGKKTTKTSKRKTVKGRLVFEKYRRIL